MDRVGVLDPTLILVQINLTAGMILRGLRVLIASDSGAGAGAGRGGLCLSCLWAQERSVQ